MKRTAISLAIVLIIILIIGFIVRRVDAPTTSSLTATSSATSTVVTTGIRSDGIITVSPTSTYPASGQTKTYTDSKNKFTLTYPATLNQEKGVFYLPAGSAQMPSDDLVRRIPIKYGSAKGDVYPETENPRIKIAVVVASVDAVKSSIEPQGLPVVLMAGMSPRIIYRTDFGVEGEGMTYFFTALDANRTLFVAVRYLDENILLDYATPKAKSFFITRANQEKMGYDIIRSVMPIQ